MFKSIFLYLQNTLNFNIAYKIYLTILYTFFSNINLKLDVHFCVLLVLFSLTDVFFLEFTCLFKTKYDKWLKCTHIDNVTLFLIWFIYK